MRKEGPERRRQTGRLADIQGAMVVAWTRARADEIHRILLSRSHNMVLYAHVGEGKVKREQVLPVDLNDPTQAMMPSLRKAGPCTESTAGQEARSSVLSLLLHGHTGEGAEVPLALAR